MKPGILLLIPFYMYKRTIRTIKWQGFSCCGHKDYDFILMNAVF